MVDTHTVNAAETVPAQHPGRCEGRRATPPQPAEVASNDPEVLRAALIREAAAARRAGCLAKIQTEVVKLALDLLVREPDLDGFFGGLTKTMVELGENHACAVWLIDDDRQRCDLWLAYISDRLYSPKSNDWDTLTLPRETMARHLFEYGTGWTETIEYDSNDSRLPEAVREYNVLSGIHSVVVAPLLLGNKTLGWVAITTFPTSDSDGWWRVALLEAIARQVTLSLHHSRLTESIRLEERRKATLEERNRLARDIHDNLAQGFAAILMQLQAAQREAGVLAPAVASNLDTAVDLARTHLSEARRSVSALRPHVGDGENVATTLKRLADVQRRTTQVPITVVVDELPRFGIGVEREIVGIAQEALTNAVRHSRAGLITIRATPVRSIGLRLSVADDGRGIAREQRGSGSGFGMTSMHERAQRIGASLTIVTAPRSGTEVVLAWEPTSLPTQIHVAE